MVKHMSQLFVIGGTYTDTDACDLAFEAWSMHNFWTGTDHNDGNNQTYWAIYDPNVTNNVVPADVYNVTGGDKNGGANLTGPKAGFDNNNKPLQDLMGRRPAIAARSPTRSIPSTTSTSPATPTPTSHSGSGLGTGAIVGIVIGSVAGLALLLLVWFCIGKRVARRRRERRESAMTQTQQLYSGNGMVSPPMSNGTWRVGTASISSQGMSPRHMSPQQSWSLPQPVPSELPSEYQDVSELPQY